MHAHGPTHRPILNASACSLSTLTVARSIASGVCRVSKPGRFVVDVSHGDLLGRRTWNQSPSRVHIDSATLSPRESAPWKPVRRVRAAGRSRLGS